MFLTCDIDIIDSVISETTALGIERRKTSNEAVCDEGLCAHQTQTHFAGPSIFRYRWKVPLGCHHHDSVPLISSCQLCFTETWITMLKCLQQHHLLIRSYRCRSRHVCSQGRA